MKLVKMLFFALVVIAMTACGSSQKKNTKEESAQIDESQAAQTMVVSEEPTEPAKKEITISDDLGADPRNYTVNGKDLKVSKGITSTLEETLGEPYIQLKSSYTYIWEADGKEYKTKFYIKDGYVDGVKETVCE